MAAPGRLITTEEFENIIIRGTATAAQVRIKDVGRAELGSQDYNSFGRLDGKPAGSMAVYLLPGANQLEASKQIYETMTRAKTLFPPDMDYKIVYDTTPAVEASIESIVHTFVEALILVTLVVFIFLQNVRATIIPLLTVPVSIIGTFIFFPMLGFSVNTLSMFGLVLAIGIVVDDAIVVVEAVIHHMERGLDPRAATIQAMKEVSGPVVGIALILSAVFVPVAFLGGLTGRMYQQFALTIAISVLLSAFSALSLSPALSVLLLKPGHGPGRGPLGMFFRGFNWVFDRATNGYIGVTRLLVRRAVLTILLIGVVVVGAGFFGKRLPAGFIPDEDQGLLGVNVQLPPGASLERTGAILTRVEQIVAKTEGVDAYTTIGGFGLVTNTYQPNFGTILIRLKDWEERHGEALHVKGIIGHLAPQFAAIPEAVIFPFNIPTIAGFGASAGFNFLLQDRSGTLSVEDLGAQTRAFLTEARQRPQLANLFTSFDPNYPQVKVELDREKARTLGIPVNDVFQAMSAVLGGAYVNDFNRFGRLFRVYVQADADYRRKPDDIGQIYVRSNTTNTMIPLSTLVTIREVPSTEITTRFNLFRSVEISGVPGPGFTSGQALAALEDVFGKTMPKEMGFAYSKLSYQEKVAPPAGPTFVMAIVFVFLLLAAMYESWRLPWAVLLGSPLVALGAFFGVWLVGYDNNVYVQVGLIMLIGLAAKNAILIVEVAKVRHEEGKPAQEAALEAARLRFRPILMTAFAFILGVVPLDARQRRGRRRAERHGHGGLLGHAGRHVPRRVHHSRQLRLRGAAGPAPSAGEGAGAGSRPRAAPDRAPGGAPVRRATALIGLVLVLAACTVGPDYRRPEVTLPALFRGLDPTAPPEPGSLGDLAWWTIFQDEVLQRLIQTALTENYDLRLAVSRILDAQAQVVITRSNQFPVVEGTAQAPFRPRKATDRRSSPWRTRSSRRAPSTSRSSSTSGAGGDGRPRRPAPSCSRPMKPATSF